MPLSWVEIHGAITHLPLAFLLAAPFFEIGALLLRKPEWRIVSFWLIAAAVVMSIPALASGWITGNDLRFTGTSTPPAAIFSQHRLLAFITSGLAIVLLLWRMRSRDRLSGRTHTASILLSLTIAGGIGYVGYLGGRMVFGDQSTEVAETPRQPEKQPDKVSSGDPQLIATGSKLYQQYRCQSCHRLNGKGSDSGPDLTHAGQRHPELEWQIAHLKNPQKMVPGSEMPAFADLSEQELRALAAFLITRK